MTIRNLEIFVEVCRHMNMSKTALSPYLKHIPLLEDQLTIICRADHTLAGKTVNLKELEHETFIGREKGSGTELLLEQAFSANSLSLKTGWVCNSIETVRQAVLHNAGIAAVSHFLVKQDVENRLLGAITVRDFIFRRQFDLIYHKDKICDTCFDRFVDTCVSLGSAGMEELILKTPFPSSGQSTRTKRRSRKS